MTVYYIKDISFMPIYVISAILFTICVCLYLCVKKISFKTLNTINKHFIVDIYTVTRLILAIFMIFIIIFVALVGGGHIYSINSYNNGHYDIVEGEIDNFKYTYPNNSKTPDGISFSVKDTSFLIRKGLFNSGYSVRDNIITQNGQKFKIYYIPVEGDSEITTILRIDK